jgi:hypothetical protein
MPQLAISVKSPGQQKALRRKALWFFLLGYSERYSIWYLILFSPRMLGYNLYIADISITGTALDWGCVDSLVDGMLEFRRRITSDFLQSLVGM